MRFALFLALVALAGCTTPAAAPASSDASDSASDPDRAVVALVTPNGDSTYVCSAEVIAPRVVLSAGHCFVGGNYDKTGWTFELFVGRDVHSPEATDRHIAVREFRLHERADLAVAFVDGDLPVTPLAWNDAPLDAAAAKLPARYLGYGANDVAAKGKRHEANAQIGAVGETDIDITATPSPCHGDSGGPLLAKFADGEKLIGVARSATVDETGNCAGGGTYTRVDTYASFLRQP